MADPDETPPETLREYFVVQLRRFRHDRGLSQAQLAERINFSPGLISMVETLQRAPTADFTAACDAALDTGGALTNLLPMIAREAYPKWFQSFVALEGEAKTIEGFEVQLVPGLLQTEEYARAVFQPDWPPRDPTELDERLKARLERQAILDRAEPPLIWTSWMRACYTARSETTTSWPHSSTVSSSSPNDHISSCRFCVCLTPEERPWMARSY